LRAAERGAAAFLREAGCLAAALRGTFALAGSFAGAFACSAALRGVAFDRAWRAVTAGAFAAWLRAFSRAGAGAAGGWLATALPTRTDSGSYT
jgi:hypothetical protein